MTIKVLEVGKAKGVLEAVGFPTAAQIDIFKSWNVTVHNLGDTGVFALGVVNAASSPGNIILKDVDGEYIVSPNYYLRWVHQDADGNYVAKPNCTRITINATVKFLVVGTYVIKIWGMHYENGNWYYDDEKIFTVTVTAEEEEEPTLWDKLKDFADKNPLAVAVGIGSVVGGAVIYQKKSEK